MTTDTETGDQIYVPKPGIVAWRVLTHLLVHPAEVLMRKDVAALTGCPQPSVDAMLQTAVVRGCLTRCRNDKLEMTWRLASVKTFRLDPLPKEGDAPKAQAPKATTSPAPEPVPAPAPSPVVVVLEKVDLTENAPQTPIKPPADQRPPATPEKRDIQPLAPETVAQIAEAFAPVQVAMPLHLTPELIEAVRTNPETSFENKADGHHAIGWLYAAYDVMVKAQIKQAA